MHNKEIDVEIETYKIEKILILNQLGIKLDYKQKAHLQNLKTEISVDNFARSLINPTIPRD